MILSHCQCFANVAVISSMHHRVTQVLSVLKWTMMLEGPSTISTPLAIQIPPQPKISVVAVVDVLSAGATTSFLLGTWARLRSRRSLAIVSGKKYLHFRYRPVSLSLTPRIYKWSNTTGRRSCAIYEIHGIEQIFFLHWHQSLCWENFSPLGGRRQRGRISYQSNAEQPQTAIIA